MTKFSLGDIVVINDNDMGIIVKIWERFSLQGKTTHVSYGVHRMISEIEKHNEGDIKMCGV